MARIKDKKQLKNFLLNIGTSGKFSGEEEFGISDYFIRYILMNCINIFGFFILLAFTVMNLRNEVYGDAIICIVMSILCIISFVMGRSKLPQAVPACLIYFSYGVMCIILIAAGQAHGANFAFIYLFPALVTMQLGMRKGIIVSMIFIILISLEMFIGLSYFKYHFDISIRMLVGYILVFFVIIVSETTRKTKDNQIETQNRWLHKLREEAEASNRMLEAAVKERTKELEEQTRIAIDANRAKSEFLATMSHEIRTPLNAVIGLSEIELRNELSNSSKSNIQQIFQSGHSLLGIINDILDISKIEAGGFKLVPVEYNTASFLNDTINLNRIRLGSKPINLIFEINGDFPEKLFGDELRVKQILNNLLSNAIKYTQKGTVTLNVSWKKAMEERENEALVRFSIKDTGRGIRAEDLSKIFYNYVQLDAKANRKIEGTGLGLVITKNLAQMMGGNIVAESEYGKGSCFIAEIFQGLVDSQSIGEKTAEGLRNFCYMDNKKKDYITNAWVSSGKILIVDDMPVNLLVARGLLKPYGFHIDTAVSGREAIELIKAGSTNSDERYDLVFMDHMMPEMDGIEATMLIREFEKNIPIVALTANAIVGMQEIFLEKGFNDFLSKPIEISKLDEILVRWIPADKRRASEGNLPDSQFNELTKNKHNVLNKE